MAPHAKTQTLEQRVNYIETKLKWLLPASGVTLAGLLAFAFWLGTISTKVSSSEQTINKVYGAVSEDPNSLFVRTSLIENRLNDVDKRLTSVDARLSSMDARLSSMNTRLDDLVNRVDLRKRPK